MSAEKYLEFYSKVIKNVDKDPKVPEAIAGVEKEFQFNFTDLPDANFYLKMHNGKISLEPKKAPNPASTLVIGSQDWDDIAHGKLNAMVALTKKKLKVEGDQTAMLKFLPILPIIQKEAKALG
jgi:putative sterol carrier protein